MWRDRIRNNRKGCSVDSAGVRGSTKGSPLFRGPSPYETDPGYASPPLSQFGSPFTSQPLHTHTTPQPAVLLIISSPFACNSF